MAERDLSQWIAELYSETREFHEKVLAGTDAAARGFALFYAPPRVGTVLLMGLNPSRKDGGYEFREAAMHGAPDQHLFLTERAARMHRKLQGFIDRACSFGPAERGDAQTALLNTNKINQIPFGSRNWAEWASRAFWPDRQTRDKAEEFGAAFVDAVVERLQPPAIICEGVGTYDWWIRRLRRRSEGAVLRNRDVARGDVSGIRLGNVKLSSRAVPVLGIPHPTGARISKKRMPLIGDLIVAALLGRDLTAVPGIDLTERGAR